MMAFCLLSNLELFVFLRYDYLEISNEKGKSFGKHCGGPYTKVVNVTGSYARLKFHSDADLQKKGFLLFFGSVPLPGKCKKLYIL